MFEGTDESIEKSTVGQDTKCLLMWRYVEE